MGPINSHAEYIEEDWGRMTEDLHELSNALLARYKTKAEKDSSKSNQTAGSSSDIGEVRKAIARGDKRFKGIILATNKQFTNDLKKEETTLTTDNKKRLNELSQEILARYAQKAKKQVNKALKASAAAGAENKPKKQEKLKGMAIKRWAGAMLANRKMVQATNESEVVNELSTNLLNKYQNAARDDIGKKLIASTLHGVKGEKEKADKAFDKAVKRINNVRKAHNIMRIKGPNVNEETFEEAKARVLAKLRSRGMQQKMANVSADDTIKSHSPINDRGPKMKLKTEDTNQQAQESLIDYIRESMIKSSIIQDKLEAIRAAKNKGKPDWEIDNSKPAPKPGTPRKVVGPYGKSYDPSDDEKGMVQAHQAAQPKRGRGRPRKYN